MRNQVSTFPDYPAEIRAPQGSLGGVSGFQVSVGKGVHTPGDSCDVLISMNAAALKQGTIEAARESERGIVDIETLTATNQTLISTLDEVMKIQEEGRAGRRRAEEELKKIENEMRQKLLTMSRTSG